MTNGAQTTALHEASFYERMEDGRVQCTLCPHDCHISEGHRGACGVRINHQGKLYTLVYDRVIAQHTEPIEKKPFFHFLPGSRAYSIATVGCSLRCAFCQNWDISQWPKDNIPRKLELSVEDEQFICPQLAATQQNMGVRMTPETIVEAAKGSGAASIAYTYTEPTIFFELARDTAVLAREAGLKNLFVSNGFINTEPLRQVAEFIDAVNIDLKFFNDASYRKVSKASLQPILDAIRLYHDLGLWVEVTTLIIPGINDSDAELRAIAQFIHSVDERIPWHVSQYSPAYKMMDRPPTPVATLLRARQIGFESGLRYVYQGNAPGQGGEDTMCHECGLTLVERRGHRILQNHVSQDGSCPNCDSPMDGVQMRGRHPRQEDSVPHHA